MSKIRRPKAAGFARAKNETANKRSRSTKSTMGKKNFPKRKSSHTAWVFQPKLENMGAVLHSIDSSVEAQTFDVWVQTHRMMIQESVRSNGYTMGAKRVKLVKEYTMSLIEGRHPENPGWLATSEVHKIPSCLDQGLIKYIADYLISSSEENFSSVKEYQVILTILSIDRLYEGLVDSSYESITEKSANIEPGHLEEFSKFVKTFLNNKKKSKKFPKFDPSQVNFEEYRFNVNKNGPNGLPKVESAHCEAVKLVKDSPLIQPYKKLCSYLGFDGLLSYVNLLAETEIPDNRPESNILIEDVKLRKLASVPDKGFKTRIVAIVDFWTQLLLEPVRAHVQDVTKFLFKQDYRMNQNDGVEAMIQFQKDCLMQKKVGDHILDIQKMKFYDMSAWTDRFHRDLQKVVMTELFSAGISECWAQLTVHCMWYVPELNGHLKYGQGQGMGTNGSFDIATLTDHLYIHFMYHQEGWEELIPHNTYGKVGDDLWIYDPGDNYQEYCKKINLPINFSKSKEFCKLGSVAEFCSRTAINGNDCSRISPNVVNRSKDFRCMPQLLSLASSREIDLKPSSFPSLQRKLKGKETRYMDKLQPWLLSAVVSSKFETNSGSAYSFLTAKYLVENNWIENEEILSLVDDQDAQTRIMIGESILSILKSNELIRDKIKSLSEVQKYQMSYDDEMQVYKTDLFSIDAETIQNLCKNVGFKQRSKIVTAEDSGLKCLLLPWELIPLVRLKTLHKNLTVKLLEAHAIEGDKVEDILKFATLLKRIANSVDFNEGNLTYDRKRVYDKQFSIVKYLERTSYPYDTLLLENDGQLDIINSVLSYNELPVEWVKLYMPELKVPDEEE